MKVLCTVSHEVQSQEPGKFRFFEAGQYYEANELDTAYQAQPYAGKEPEKSEKPTAIEAVNTITIAEVEE